jgi:hypothetical protein
LRRVYPSLAVLRIVDKQESVPGEIRVPFTQAALLDRVSALLGSRAAHAGEAAEKLSDYS